MNPSQSVCGESEHSLPDCAARGLLGCDRCIKRSGELLACISHTLGERDDSVLQRPIVEW